VSEPGRRLHPGLRGRNAELRGRRSECGALDRLIDAVRAGESRALDAGHFTWEDAADEYAERVSTWWSGGYAITGSAAAR
jgi:hypothetical protein